MASMREQMPTVAAWIDDLRLAFGSADVTAWIRQGRADGTFYASENGHEVGAPIPPPANAISARDMVIEAAFEPATKKARR